MIVLLDRNFDNGQLLNAIAVNCPGFDGGLDGWVYATSLDCSNSR
jgi:hypothetical protein